MADGDPPTHRRWAAGRSLRRRRSRHRPLFAYAGRSANRVGAVGPVAGCLALVLAGLRRRRQRGDREPERAATRVCVARAAARALDATGQPGLGDHDGLGPWRELAERTDSAASVGQAAEAAHRPADAAVSRRRGAGQHGLRGVLPFAAARRSAGHERGFAAQADGRSTRERGRGCRFEQLGAGRQPQRHWPSAAGQRPSPQALDPGAVVLRPPRSAGPQDRRRDLARLAWRGDGPERTHRLGSDQYRP